MVTLIITLAMLNLTGHNCVNDETLNLLFDFENACTETKYQIRGEEDATGK